MQNEIQFGGVRYVSVRIAADEAAMSRDYVARLCNRKLVNARRIGSAWYIEMRSLRGYLKAQEHAREHRRQSLARERASEYQEKRSQLRAVIPALAVPEAAIPEKIQNVIDDHGGAGMQVLSDASRVPGLMHAAANIPAQALVHVPTYAVTPAVELAHRLVALVSAFVIVFGAYSLVDHTYAVYARDSIVSMAGVAIRYAGDVQTTAAAADASLATAVDRFASDPAPAANRLSASAYEAATAIAARVPVQLLFRSLAWLGSSADASVRSVIGNAGASASAAAATPALLAPSVPAQAAAAAAPSTPAPASPAPSNGLTEAGGSIATAIPFTGRSVAYGDLVAFNPANGTYTLTSGTNDPSAYGIVVRDPALLFKPDSGSTNVAVIRSGSTLVNVTLENGPIAVGDPLTSSSIPGKARKANAGEHAIGVAVEAFGGQGGVSLREPNGTLVPSGTISVNINTGMGVGTLPGVGSGAGQGDANCNSLSCLLSAIDPQAVRSIVRYLLSGLIAALTLTLAFKSFMSDANYGVISMGRNPRAKSSIQSLVFVNAFLALAITSIGLFAAMMVLFTGS